MQEQSSKLEEVALKMKEQNEQQQGNVEEDEEEDEEDEEEDGEDEIAQDEAIKSAIIEECLSDSEKRHNNKLMTE